MKPNPVKKTVEYCARKGECCNAYEKNNDGAFCMKHNKYTKVLGDLTNVDRPKWCTDETFVRVKIEPFIHNNTEYCRFMDGYSIGESNGRCNLLPVGGTYCPCLRNNIAPNHGMTVERPEACRKLEV